MGPEKGSRAGRRTSGVAEAGAVGAGVPDAAGGAAGGGDGGSAGAAHKPHRASPGLLAALLALVTGVQALATFAVLALPTLATKAAPAYGFGAETVGYQLSIVYVAAASVSSIAGLCVRRWGAAAASTLALLLGVLGLAGLASGVLVAALAGSLLIGGAYGLTNPAASRPRGCRCSPPGPAGRAPSSPVPSCRSPSPFPCG